VAAVVIGAVSVTMSLIGLELGSRIKERGLTEIPSKALLTRLTA
jgi:hypothetical protein